MPKLLLLVAAKILRSIILPLLCVAMLVGCIQSASFNTVEQRQAKSSTYQDNSQTQESSLIYKAPREIKAGVKPPFFPDLPEENPNGE